MSIRMFLMGATILALGGFCSSVSAQCLPYGPVVSLAGTLSSRVFAGPPNYESIKRGDRKETAIILKLVKPTCTKGNDPPQGLDDPENGIREMQLVVRESAHWKVVRHRMGKRVIVTGTLFHWHTGHHRTKVLIDVNSIRAAGGKCEMFRSFFVLSLLAFISIGYGQVRSEKMDIPGKGSSANADDGARKAVVGAFKKLCEMKTFRTRTIKQVEGTNVLTVRISEFVGTDRRRTTYFAQGAADGGFEETITIGPRTYSWSKGTWTEMKGPLNPFDFADKCPSENDLENLPRNLKSVGTGEVNGIKVLLYRSSVGSGQAEVTYSIGEKDGLFYRIGEKYGIFASGSGSTDPEGNHTSTTYFSDYNADIRIESPV